MVAIGRNLRTNLTLPSNQNVINLTSDKSLKSVIIEVFSFGSVLESSILSRNPPMELLRGRNLINKAGQLFLAEDVLNDNSLIVFFFSAGWCEGVQCNLVLYKLLQIKEESVKQSLQLQIVFVSSDTDSYSFDNYFRYHGDWYAVPFEDELAEILRWNYGITHLPHVVVCKPEGVIVTKKGRQEIIEKGLNVLVTWSEHKNT